MSSQRMMLVLFAGWAVLVAVVVVQHTRITALAERIQQLQVVDYRQNTVNVELQSQINIERECINRLLSDPMLRDAVFCNENAFSKEWTHTPTEAALEKNIGTSTH